MQDSSNFKIFLSVSAGLFAFLFLLLPAAHAQQQRFTIKVDTQLVVETVVVKDKDGRTIEGLSEKDFTVSEDNVPQTISVFEFQKLDNSAAAASSAAPVSAVRSANPAQISPPTLGDARYRDRRLLVLFFDMMTTPPPDQLRAFAAAGKFIRNQMQTPDLIAIMTFQKGLVSVLQDFTDDRAALLETLARLMYPEDDNSDDTAGVFGQDAGEFNLFNTDRQLAALQTAVKIPGSELVLARSGGAERTLIDFIGEIKDDYGTTIQNLRDKVDIKLSGETAGELSRRPIQYDTGYTLLPGKYLIKFLARDAETGRIGTYQAPFVIPNLMKEDKRIPISSVVLSSQRVDMREALFNAAKDKNAAAAQAANPLVVDGQKLIPSVTRVFSKSRDMYVYLQAYQRNATATQPLIAFVTFYRGKSKAFETTPLEVVDGLDPKSKALPLRFSLSLSKLPAGEYNCQITILDPTGQKAAFWQAPVMLVR